MNKEIFNYLKLKAKMREFGYTQQDLANYLTKNGISTSLDVVKSWFRKDINARSVPELNKIVLISKMFNISSDELLSNTKNIYQNIKLVPIVGSASCGIPLPNSYQEIENKAFCKSEIWHSDLYAIIANGDSMIPEIDDGDEVICDPKADILSGDIVHYQINDESAIKVFFKDENIGVMEFVPFNQNGEFKTLKFRIDDDSVYIRMCKVIAINKSKMNNRQARLKAINRL